VTDQRPAPATTTAMSDAIDDWPTGIETWASTAQSAPQSTTQKERLRMIPNEQQARPGTGGGPKRLTDRAMEAGERLLEASTEVGNAYADAYQEAVISMADFREKLGGTGAVDWGKLAPQAGPPAASMQNETLLGVAGTMTRINEQILAATKKLGLAYLEACEQMVLSAVELQEQAVPASESTLLGSAGPAPAGVVRDVTKAYVEAARRLLA
jgi:acyl-CoA reductase-like NAD-dependent aldehyde dehydrogenase